jgi:hypothetical protein
MLTFDMARKCKREGRKTISTEDLFQSLHFLGKILRNFHFIDECLLNLQTFLFCQLYMLIILTHSGFSVFVPYLRLHVRACRLAKAVSYS